jgi:hypothetical protein
MAACGWSNVPFPLTPALSLGEREKRSRLWNKAAAVSEAGRALAPKRAGGPFPLPEGDLPEGEG